MTDEERHACWALPVGVRWSLTGILAQSFYEAATHPGMAHWALTGPADTTCRECHFWAPNTDGKPRYRRNVYGALKDRRCRKYQSLTHGVTGSVVPHYARSCKFFQPADSPPPIEKLKRERNRRAKKDKAVHGSECPALSSKGTPRPRC